MKKYILSILLLSVFAIGNTSIAFAQAGHEEHHPQAAQPTTQSMEQGSMMGGMPCGPGMMGGMRGGMGMGQRGGMMCPMCGMMMGSGMSGMEGMPGMGMGRMMGGRGMGMMGMMGSEEMAAQMDRPFFLNRAEELGLSPEQVARLRSIRQAARTDNIRNLAELKIARLELHDLLAGEWTVEAAEKLVRNIQKMQGDMKIRYLKAKKEAEKVLTAEQLKKARGEEELEELFQ